MNQQHATRSSAENQEDHRFHSRINRRGRLEAGTLCLCGLGLRPDPNSSAERSSLINALVADVPQWESVDEVPDFPSMALAAHQQVALEPRHVGKLLHGIPATILAEMSIEDAYPSRSRTQDWIVEEARRLRVSRSARYRRSSVDLIVSIMFRCGWAFLDDRGQVVAISDRVRNHEWLAHADEIHRIVGLWGLTIEVDVDTDETTITISRADSVEAPSPDPIIPPIELYAPPDRTDDEVVATARAGEDGDRFSAVYYGGDLSAYDGDLGRAVHDLAAILGRCDAGSDQISRIIALAYTKVSSRPVAAQAEGEAARSTNGASHATPFPDPSATDPEHAPPSTGVETPHQLGRTILFEDFTDPAGLQTLIKWQDDFHGFDGFCYRVLPKETIRDKVTRSVERQYHADYATRLAASYIQAHVEGKDPKIPKLRSVTTGVVRDVIQAISGMASQSADQVAEQPSWIGDPPRPWAARDILPTRNALVHLPSLVAGEPATTSPTPRYFARYCLGYDFDAKAPKPAEWLRFLRQLWGLDLQSIALLQEWVGYLLTPDTSQQKILMLIGPPRCGKGTIARIIQHLIGAENCCNPTLSGLATQFGLEGLIGRSAAIISDARVSGKTDTAVVVERLLAISGEDGQSIHRKHRSELNVKLPTRFMIVSNEIPNIKDASNALANRYVILRLRHSFLGAEDTALYQRLAAELPGILLWAIEGLSRLKRNGRFTSPLASEDLKEAIADSSSPILAFLRECCQIGTTESVVVDELYFEWKTWNMGNGRDHVGDKNAFGVLLHAAVPGLERNRLRINRKRQYFYSGLRLLTEGETLAASEEQANF